MAPLTQTKTNQPTLTRRSFSWTWVGVAPFFLFVAAFLIWPALSIIGQSFLDQERRLTLQNILELGRPFIVSSYVYSVQLSAVRA